MTHARVKDLMEAIDHPAEDLDHTTGVWLLGPKGVGKSYYVRHNYGYTKSTLYVKNANKWYDGWSHEHEAVLVDDVDLAHTHLGSFLKIWGDEYAFLAETKGGTKYSIRPKHVFVTSNYSPMEIWGNDPTLAGAIMDRFELVDARNWTRKRDNKNIEKWAALTSAGKCWTDGVGGSPPNFGAMV
jgi:hypothetical protein